MTKLQVIFVQKNDCYVSLPREVGSLIEQEYSDNAICRALKLTRFDKSKLYVGFTGGVSKTDNSIEIAYKFGECLQIQEYEMVDVEVVSKQKSETRLKLKVSSPEDYELVARMREQFEESLLNQISVVFEGEKFPAYFGGLQYVVLKYIGSEDGDSGCKMIHPSAELIILEEEAKDKVEGDHLEEEEEEEIKTLNFRAIDREFGENDRNEHKLFISAKVFHKFKMQENKLYKLTHQRILKENDYTDFKTFLNKQQRLQKQKQDDQKEPVSQIGGEVMVVIAPSEELDEEGKEGVVIVNSLMCRCLNIINKSVVIIDLKYELDNIKDNRVLTVNDFCSNQNQIKLVFRQIYANKGKDDLKSDHSFILNQVINRHKRNEQDIYYTDQIHQINGNFYIIKILEIMQDVKPTLRMLLFDNASSSLHSSLNKSSDDVNINNQQNSSLKEGVTASLIFISQQEYFNDFQEGDILSINKLVSNLLSPDKFIKIKLNIFSSLYKQELNSLEQSITSSLHAHSKQASNSQIVLVTGKSQSGKTFLAEYLKSHYPLHHVEYLDFAELQENVPLDYAKNYIASKIQLACLKSPSFLLCDNVDRTCQSLDRIDFQQFQLILVSEIISKYLKDAIKKYSASNSQVHFLLLSDSKDLLNKNLHKIIQLQLNLETANYAKRKKLFQYIQEACQVQLDVDELGSSTENFTLNQFFLLSQKIFQEREIITKEDILNKVSDLSNKSFKSSKNFPKFEHVGGLDEVKDIIRETFEVPIKYEFLFANIPIKLPRGVLLYGPSGCGKTYLAKATANELGLNFFSVKGPEILNKYIGASEQAVRDIFEKAYSVRPSIVFFDEFDAIVPRRNSGSTGVTDRVVNQFLCYLDGVSSLEGVCILAASSRPDLIDPALLRPGRIDRHVYLGFPTEEERRLILDIYGKNLKMEEGMNLNDLVKLTNNFTSSDLVAFLKEIRIKMAHDMIEEKKQNAAFEFDFTLTKAFCDKTFNTFRPSLNEKDVIKFEAMYRKFNDPKAVQDISKQKQTLN